MCYVQVMCRFSDAGKTCSPRAHAAGVRKAPRHEIAVGGAPGGAASAMGIWVGRACRCDLMAAVRMIALGQKIAASTLNARPVRCASGFEVGLRGGVARRCRRERTRMEVVDAVADRWCRHHEVSILIAGGTGVGRCFGCCPRKKVSMMIMRPPQQGQGCCGCFGSSGVALAALMASIGMSGTASNSRARAIFLARVWLVSRP